MTASIPRPWIAPLCVLGLAWSQGAPEPVPAPAQLTLPGAIADEAPPRSVSADELWAHPSSFLAKTVVIEVQIHSRMESWNPFLTRFGDGEFSAWAAWSDAQFPWLEAEFNAPRARLFARRGGPAEWALEGAQPYDRFELSCSVRSVFANRPWLEVIAVKPLVRKLSEGCIIHATRGLEFMQREAWQAAIGEFERAASAGIPAPALAELERLKQVCREKLPPALYEPKKG
jgi:hypothetical protein